MSHYNLYSGKDTSRTSDDLSKAPPWYKEKRDWLIVSGVIGITVAVVAAYGFFNLADVTRKVMHNYSYILFLHGFKDTLLYFGLMYYCSMGLWPILIAYSLILLGVSYKHYWWWALVASILSTFCFTIMIFYEYKSSQNVFDRMYATFEDFYIGTGMVFLIGLPYMGILAGLLFWLRYKYKERRTLRNERV